MSINIYYEWFLIEQKILKWCIDLNIANSDFGIATADFGTAETEVGIANSVRDRIKIYSF